MSDLGDLIVEQPFTGDQPFGAHPADALMRHVDSLNALRDELIELRDKVAASARLQDLLAQAAAGRREYAVNAPDGSALVLEDQARQLEAVARLARGDMTVMTVWLPSWRWTHEMAPDVIKKTADGRGGSDGA